MMALIYALAAALLIGLLVSYFYFSVLQQNSPNPANMITANIALLLFVNAVLVFALLLIWLENIPDNSKKSSSDKSITSAEKQIPEKEHNAPIKNTNQIEPILQRLNQISQSLSLTNKTLNLGLERLSTRIDEVENASLEKIIKQDETSENHPDLSTIFNDDLAKTLSGLEIMKDTSTTNANDYEEVDLDILLDDKNTKK